MSVSTIINKSTGQLNPEYLSIVGGVGIATEIENGVMTIGGSSTGYESLSTQSVHYNPGWFTMNTAPTTTVETQGDFVYMPEYFKSTGVFKQDNMAPLFFVNIDGGLQAQNFQINIKLGEANDAFPNGAPHLFCAYIIDLDYNNVLVSQDWHQEHFATAVGQTMKTFVLNITSAFQANQRLIVFWQGEHTASQQVGWSYSQSTTINQNSNTAITNSYANVVVN